MNVTGDRTAPHGLSTVGFDDEGVAAQSLGPRRATACSWATSSTAAWPRSHGFGRSNGCAFADSRGARPDPADAQRVSLQPDPAGPDLEGLIGGVEDGLYIVGDKSWSIDMQRYNFQFTGQRFFRIRSGRIVGQVRDVAYQSSTPTFWGLDGASAGRQTYLLGGALNCGKAQPGQVAAGQPRVPGRPCSRAINVLNTRAGGARMRPQEMVERALELLGPDRGTVVVEHAHQRQPAVGELHTDDQRR